MATHSSFLAWRIPQTEESTGLWSTELQKSWAWLKWLSTPNDFTRLCDFFFHCAMLCLVAQLCLTLRDPLDHSPPGSSVHGIFQAGILEWVAFSYSRGSSWPRDRTYGSCDICIARKFFTCWAAGKLKEVYTGTLQEKFNFSCLVNR